MPARTYALLALTSAYFAPGALLSRRASADDLDPIVYSVSVPDPGTHVAEVVATIPTDRLAEVELRMAIWTPGYYKVEDYAARVRDLAARTPAGQPLDIERAGNRWRVRTGGGGTVVISYRLTCDQRSVTTNWVGPDLAVINGAAAFPTRIETARRPHEVWLARPSAWKRSISALPPAPDGLPDHYRAEDYDQLVDTPIVAGDPSIRSFEVDDSRHELVDIGVVPKGWDAERAVTGLEAVARENGRLWGRLPFHRYVFLNVFRAGGGGLEHRDCTLLTASPRLDSPRAQLGWLGFASHEYFHAFNVKRLRPVELGPFDYDHAPITPSLWISEGLTSYYGNLLVARAGVSTANDLLGSISGWISQLQSSPGRLKQTLEEASRDVWGSGVSGIGRDPTTSVSYYVKGPVVGFLLDAAIRRATGGARSLDDAMRLAFARHSGERGFTPEQFRMATEEVAGVDLRAWFGRSLASTEELDYSEALGWFGLRFMPDKPWTLEVLPGPTEAQAGHLKDWLAPSGRR